MGPYGGINDLFGPSRSAIIVRWDILNGYGKSQSENLDETTSNNRNQASARQHIEHDEDSIILGRSLTGGLSRARSIRIISNIGAFVIYSRCTDVDAENNIWKAEPKWNNTFSKCSRHGDYITIVLLLLATMCIADVDPVIACVSS